MSSPRSQLFAALPRSVSPYRLPISSDGLIDAGRISCAAIKRMPAVAAVQNDPRQLLAWYPMAQASRKLHPDAFAALDAAFGGAFPFPKDRLEAAHARCTSDWLAWERSHDAEYSLKAAQVEDDIARAGGAATPLLRTRLAALEQEKLERYQQRYEEYVKTVKAIAAFMS